MATPPNESMCKAVVAQVIERVRASGYEEAVCRELRDHFARLPARYTLNIDVERHDDVLLHMRLLQEALEAEVSSCKPSSDTFRLPIINVRKVQLVNGSPQLEAEDTHNDNDGSRWKGVPIPKLPKPAFGSSTNLSGFLSVTSARIHPSISHARSQSNLAHGAMHGTSPSTGNSPIPRPMFGSSTNSLDMDDEEYSSGNEDSNSTYGYEITFATTDRHGLLKYFTSALSNSSLELNIKEAHVFSTTNGMALEVFVVEGWPGDEPEELRQAVLLALSSKLNDMSPGKGRLDADSQLRALAEAIAYEDWAVDYNLLVIGERLGGGSFGRLYRGKYLSQDVAIKMILLDEERAEPHIGTSSSTSASKLLQVFKQEVSIMRLVRHKNLVQFIGACACWPKLCIVTELMAGGSVRDLLESRGCGLEISAAVKVLRDAARGMNFLHKRGIVHRDLKSANLLIDEHDVVKVCDFGVARLKPSSVNGPSSGNWPAEMTAETGTYRWMAPEVLEHKPYDHKADVYSFGILIWELLTGEIPYTGLTPLQAGIGVVQRGLRPVMPPSVPEKLCALAQACWHQEPKQRPEFSEIISTLEDMIKPATWRTGFFKKKKSVKIQ